MIRQEKISGHSTHNVRGFKVKVKLRKRSYKSQGLTINPKSAKTNKQIRCAAIADSMPNAFMAIAADAKRKEKRAEEQRNSRRAKRAK